jgi:Pyruvate/2-oxoacid:ferredoxin oxidoreductase delta subunit
MKRAIINPEKCVNCTTCEAEKICRHNAFIREKPQEKPWIDFYQCRGCLKCKPACLYDAVGEIIQPCNGKGKMSW